MKFVEIVFTEESKQDYNSLSKELRKECNVILRRSSTASIQDSVFRNQNAGNFSLRENY
jgi:hypothetical protein